MSKAALTRLRSDLDSPTFTWKGTEVPCVPQTVGVLAVVSLGGFEMQVQATLRVELSEFLSADSTLISADSTLYTDDDDRPRPVTGKTLVFRGRTYKVGRVAVSPCNSYASLDLVDRNA